MAVSTASGSAWKEDYSVFYGTLAQNDVLELLQLTNNQIYEPRHARVEYAPSMIVDIGPVSGSVESKRRERRPSFWGGIVRSLSI